MTDEPNEDELPERDFSYTGAGALNGPVDSGWDEPEEFTDDTDPALEELEERIEQLEKIVYTSEE